MTNEAINSLRKKASQVYQPCPDMTPSQTGARLSARGAARRLWPSIYAASTRYSEGEMRTACAILAASHPSAWPDARSSAPGTVLDVCLASTARWLLRFSSEENVQAALAFWATETDAAEWQAVIH